MSLVWTAIRQAGRDFWEEMLFLLVFNAVWLLGGLFILPLPFLTFALFFTAYDIGQGKGIHFSTFFRYAGQTWKPALVWGAANLGALFVLWTNLNFYGQIQSQWAAMVQIAFIGLTAAWLVTQLFALPLYPRLEKPGLRLALRNAVIMMARYPLAALTALLFGGLVVGISLFFAPAFAFLGGTAYIVLLCNQLAGLIVARELGEPS
ncbi:MAG: hypothetical protein D6784_00425 [Chloroflexi bacterium]|nr:MAG: hypothetical protein D6784_00425 [Chloroflexota bacterium]